MVYSNTKKAIFRVCKSQVNFIAAVSLEGSLVREVGPTI